MLRLLPARRDGSASRLTGICRSRSSPCTQGCFLHTSNYPTLLVVFSLHAGMVPIDRAGRSGRGWLLPARRDGSGKGLVRWSAPRASPCTQGWFIFDGICDIHKKTYHCTQVWFSFETGRRKYREGLSLHAGMVLDVWQQLRVRVRLLPARRDGSYDYTDEDVAKMYSPCTQGWFALRHK